MNLWSMCGQYRREFFIFPKELFVIVRDQSGTAIHFIPILNMKNLSFTGFGHLQFADGSRNQLRLFPKCFGLFWREFHDVTLFSLEEKFGIFGQVRGESFEEGIAFFLSHSSIIS